MDGGHHFRVQRRHHLIEPFQHGHFQTATAEVLDHFQSDVSAPHNHRPGGRPTRQPGKNPVGIVEVSQTKDAGQVDSRQRRPDRRRAGCQHQHIVRLGSGQFCLHISHRDGLLRAIDRLHLMVYAGLDTKGVAKPLGRGHQQFGAVGNHAADEVGQAAIGE